MLWASKNGHLSVLKAWLHAALPFDSVEKAIELASKHNQMEVLNWWKEMGFDVNPKN